MELLYSNIRPCEYNNSTFGEAFESGIVQSDGIKIATGYITEESLLELKSILSFYFDEKKIKIALELKIPVIFTDSESDTANQLILLAKRYEKNKLKAPN